MNISQRYKRLIIQIVRILADAFINISKSFPSFSDDEQQTTRALPSQNMTGKVNGAEQELNQPRVINLSGSPNVDAYYRFFAVKRFKILAVIIVLISACYHGILHLRHGHNTCKWLLTDGRFQGYYEWQPHGCMIHRYSKNNFRNCMHYISYWGGKNHFAFVGDSRIRQLYYEFVGHLSKEPLQKSKSRTKLSHHDAKANVLVEFFWAPFVDNSMRKVLESWTLSGSSPRLVVVGSATWTIKLNNGSEDAIPSFKNNITSISSIISRYKESSDVVWMLQDHVVEARLSPNKSMITNRQIDLYNRATIESLISSRAQIWSSSVLIGQTFLGKDFVPKKSESGQASSKHEAASSLPPTTATTTTTNPSKKTNASGPGATKSDRKEKLDDDEETGDGLHLSQDALGWDVQVLLNMICNNFMNFDDGSCCTVSESPTTVQMILAFTFATSLVVAVVMTACRQLSLLIQKVSTMKKGNRGMLRKFRSFVHLSKDPASRDSETKRTESREKFTNEPNHGREDNLKPDWSDCVLASPAERSTGGNVDLGTSCSEPPLDPDEGGALTEVLHCSASEIFMQHGSSPRVVEHESNPEPSADAANADKKPRDARSFPPAPKFESISPSHSVSRTSSSPLLSTCMSNLITNPQLHKEEHVLDFYSAVCCLAKLGVILSYFFVCDRTTFFMKENKYYTHVNFFLPFTYLMVLGIFFTEKTEQMEILNRNQTDEWKGWMQIVILIYHLTGAGKVLSIYMQIRVMVSAYIFLSAYGHFTYFFNNADFSLRRLCVVIVRFNFMVVLLCLAMNRPYQFYYFMPLITFWFVVIYLIMASPPRATASNNGSLSVYWWLIIKLIILTTFVTLLYSSEVFFDKIFLSYALKPLFASSDDSIHGWRFRWNMDRYSSIFGLAFSLILVLVKKIQTVNDSSGNDLVSSRIITFSSMALASCGVVCYAIFTSMCQSKNQCNETHSYISFVPILCYIVLRNVLGCARRKFSAFFAWFGKISLELFIAQYHIWLAADTHGIMVLIPSYPVLNLIVTSFVFVCVAHEIKVITTKLTPLLVPASKVSLLRNIILVVIFIVIRHFWI